MEHDVLLCREILVCEPFKPPKGSVERGKIWTKIADTLNSLTTIRFKVNQRGVRERYERLRKKFLEKQREEEKASGISPEETELDSLLEEITDREKLADETRDNTTKKAEADKNTAEEMRKLAMERVSETQKRGDEEGCSSTKKKRKRRSGNEAVEFLREKSEREMRLREEELADKRAQQAQDANRQDQLVRQQMEMHNMQRLMLQQQQQQTAAMMSLLEKVLNKQ